MASSRFNAIVDLHRRVCEVGGDARAGWRYAHEATMEFEHSEPTTTEAVAELEDLRRLRRVWAELFAEAYREARLLRRMARECP